MRQQLRLLAVVRGVEGLHAVEAGVLEPAQRLADLAWLPEVEERVRPDRDAARGVDRVDGLRDRRRRAAAVGGAARDEIGLEERRRLGEAGRFQSLAVRGDRRRREVRAPERAARGEARVELRPVGLEAQVAQERGHALDPVGAVGAPVRQALAERLVVVVDAVAEDVEVLPEIVDGRQLDRRHEVDLARARGRERLVDAVDRVVVRERQQLDPRGRRGGHDGGRLERSVRARRVRL